jgi:hypothetical protein
VWPERAIASGNMGDIPEAIGAVFLQSKLQGMHPGLLKILVPFRLFDAGEMVAGPAVAFRR